MAIRGICIFLTGVCLAGPVQAGSLAGEWNCGFDQQGPPVDLAVTYDPDGGFQRFILVNDYFEGREFAVDLVASGRWSMKGAKLTERLTKVEVQRMYLEGEDATDDPQLAGLRSQIEAMAGEQPAPVRLRFDGPDLFRSESQWGATECQRVEIVED